MTQPPRAKHLGRPETFTHLLPRNFRKFPPINETWLLLFVSWGRKTSRREIKNQPRRISKTRLPDSLNSLGSFPAKRNSPLALKKLAQSTSPKLPNSLHFP